MSREQYVDYAISKGLRIDDDQLRMPPRFRNVTSIDELTTKRAGMTRKDVESNPKLLEADKKYDRFIWGMREKAGTDLEPGIRVSSGTKDSDSWVFWGINKNDRMAGQVTDKAYLGFDNPYMSLTPERLQSFLRVLRDAGYNGGMKVAGDLGRATFLSDQIVLHGNTKADAQLAMKLGKQFFKKDLTFSEMGQDTAAGSYSQNLAAKIEEALRGR